MLWCDLNVLLIPRGTSTPCVDCHLDTCTGFSAAEDEEEEDISEESPPERPSVFSCLPASLECLADTSDSCFLQFESCPMEESWFITPPPCFTAGGLTTIKVETSPMENLLIEHPSMSVYAVHEPCPRLSEAHCGTEEFHNPGSPRYVTVSTDIRESMCLVYKAGNGMKRWTHLRFSKKLVLAWPQLCNGELSHLWYSATEWKEKTGISAKYLRI